MSGVTTTSTFAISNTYMEPVIPCLVDDPRCLPKRAHATDAGADLFSVQDLVLRPGQDAMIDTGLALKLPRGYAGIVVNRSSQRVNCISSLGAGIIDTDYRGKIKVFLYNNGDTEYVIEAYKTKIAQLLIMPVLLARFEDCWNDTKRGTGGFGSTGV
ncbi:MAG: dUTP diphosphatase [bacterium]|jgi:dUTP pyrophosphatase